MRVVTAGPCALRSPPKQWLRPTMSAPVKRSLPRSIGNLAGALGLLALLAGKPSLAQIPPENSSRVTEAQSRDNGRPERPIAKGYPVPADRLQAVTANLQEHFAAQPA